MYVCAGGGEQAPLRYDRRDADGWVPTVKDVPSAPKSLTQLREARGGEKTSRVAREIPRTARVRGARRLRVPCFEFR